MPDVTLLGKLWAKFLALTIGSNTAGLFCLIIKLTGASLKLIAGDVMPGTFEGIDKSKSGKAASIPPGPIYEFTP